MEWSFVIDLPWKTQKNIVKIILPYGHLLNFRLAARICVTLMLFFLISEDITLMTILF